MKDFSILMSMKPRFTHEIFNTCKKEVELRKSLPMLYTGDPFLVYVYESGSGYVIGHFTCDYIALIDKILPDETVEQLSTLACVTPDEFREYRPTRAYWICKRILYTKPIPYKEFAKMHNLSEKPPQSWCYITK